MPKPRKLKQFCTYCNKRFNRVASHTRHCKEAKSATQAEDQNRIALSYAGMAGEKRGMEQVKNEQTFRGKDAIISFTEGVTKLNQALAQIISEWRW